LPWHAGRFQHRNRFTHVTAHVLEVCDARVVVILAGKEGAREISRVRIGKGMILCIPAPKTNVKTANTRAMIVDDNDFLVMRPKLDIIYQISTLAKLK
jgi:hypothetical protein